MKRSHVIFPEMAHQPEGSFWNVETGKTLRLKYGSRGEPRGLVLLVEPISEARASVRCRGRINAPRRAVPPTHPPRAAVTKTPGPGRARTPNQHSDLTQETPRASDRCRGRYGAKTGSGMLSVTGARRRWSGFRRGLPGPSTGAGSLLQLRTA